MPLAGPIAKLDGDGDLVQQYVYGSSPWVPDYVVPWWEGVQGSPLRVLTDHRGSVTHLVEAGTTGSVSERQLALARYDAWGASWTDVMHGTVPFGFAGGFQDPATGLVLFGSRWYDPTTGSFTSVDPLGQAGGLNVYAYAGGDPVNQVDPTGEHPVAVVAFLALLKLYDAYDTVSTMLDPCVPLEDKMMELGFMAAGAFSPGGKGPLKRAAKSIDKVRDRLKELKRCFVEGTEVEVVSGTVPIETVREGDRVLAASGEAGPWWWVEDGPVSPAVPTSVWTCAVPPAWSTTVEVYEARTGSWSSGEAGAVPVGGELWHAGHLYRVGRDGFEEVGAVSLTELAAADAAWTEWSGEVPSGSTWVLVMGSGGSPEHARLSSVEAGVEVAYGGELYATWGKEEVEAVRSTGEVLGRVERATVRTAPGVYDLTVRDAAGAVGTLRGTGEHRFWLPAARVWRALADLEAGVVLRTRGGGEATVLGVSFEPGLVEVYNFEVAGVHDYFVRGEGGDAAAVLVHNGYEDLTKGAKRGPKTDPSAPHNAKIRSESDALSANGNEILAGGGVYPETLIPTHGGHKSGRRPDILYRTPTNELRGVNVGRTLKNGSPVPRELKALEDLNGPGGLPTNFVPYDR